MTLTLLAWNKIILGMLIKVVTANQAAASRLRQPIKHSPFPFARFLFLTTDKSQRLYQLLIVDHRKHKLFTI